MGTTRKTAGTGSANRSNQKKVSGAAKSAQGSETTRKTANTKKTTASGSGKRTGGARKTASSGNGKSGKNNRQSRTTKSIEEMNEYQDHLAFEQGMTILVAGVVVLICYLSYLGFAGGFGTVVGGLLFGLFGWLAWLVPIGGMVALAAVIANQHDKRIKRKIISAAAVVILLSALTDLVTGAKVLSEYYQMNSALHRGGAGSVYLALRDCLHLGKASGGQLGRLVSGGLVTVLGRIGAGFVMVALLCLCIYLFYGVEMMQHLRKRNAYYQEMEQAYEVIQQEDYQKPSYQLRTPNPRKKLYSGRRMQTVNLQQMGQQLDEQEKEQRKNRKTTDKVQNLHAEIEEIIPDSKLGTQGRKQAEEIRLRHLQEEKEQSEKQASASEEQSEHSKESKSKVENIPIYREEMQQKFGKKKDASALLQDGGHIVVEPDLAKPSQDRNIESAHNHETIVERELAAEQELLPEVNPEVPSEVDVEAATLSGMSAETVQAVMESEEDISAEMQDDSAFDIEPEEEPGFLDDTEADDYSGSPARPKALSGLGMSAQPAGNRQSAGGGQPAGSSRLAGGSQSAGGSRWTGSGQSSEVPKPQNTVETALEQKQAERPKRPHQFPPVKLLSVPDEIPGRTSDEELRNTALKLQETLRSFNVNVTMGAVTCGPTVTRYELLPEQGVRVNKITNLSDDLKLSMAATSIRIEAPIPGKAAVGIEVPNSTASPVYFRELLEGDAFQKAKSPITFAVGKDIAGKRIMTDIAKMPHLLIAGATGSGKSVCINTLIMSILYKADPSDVKLIMIDPKVVELSVYNGIPHLFCPVVTDPKEAAASLNWAVREMMERYNKFKELGVRNISGYNQKIKTVEDAEKAGYTKMPSLVIIVDEFADLMMVASKEVEDAVCRLAQLARAAGIHLVLATQRPSVNVITGVIKANIPSRIAFSVSSAIDSRTILDKGGAEKLLGKGDMLFFPAGYSEPVRVQGAFISDKEVSDVVNYLIEANEQPEYNNAVTEIVEEAVEPAESKEEKKKPDHDEYFEEAGKFVIESERAAAGQLQRRFSIGFNRAGRIIDQLHQAGVIGPAEGTKPRKVLMTMAEFEASLHGVDVSASEGEMAEDVLLDMDKCE